MPIIYNADGTTTLIHRYRKAGALGGTTRRRTIGTQKHIEVSKAWADLVDECDGSLTVRFKQCVEHAVSENGGAGMASVYKIIKTRLGKYRVDEKFVLHYQAFVDELKSAGRSVNTVSNYKASIRHALRRAWLNGLIAEIPIRDFGIMRKFRSRILSSDERTRLYAHLNPDASLYWMVYFSERNPIRKMDLSNLRRENLVLVGPNAPYVRFYPAKTAGSETRRPCVLPGVDEALLGWFARVERDFPDCPFLFPHIRTCKRAGTATWSRAGNWRRAFKTICQRAQIRDFHIHDLRHCAFTAMRREGIDYDTIQALGMQATEAAIRIYDQSDAMDALRVIREKENRMISVSHLEREVI